MRDSNDRSVLMKPEGSRKVAVLNGSRQLDQVIGGQWTTLKVLPENGLPKGIYQLADAKQPDTAKGNYSGQILQVDNDAVYQLNGKGITRHSRAVFHEMESKGVKLNVGQSVDIGYQNGKGVAKEPERGAARPVPGRKLGGQEI